MGMGPSQFSETKWIGYPTKNKENIESLTLNRKQSAYLLDSGNLF